MLRDGSEPPLWYCIPIQPNRDHRRHLVNTFVITVLCALTLALLLVAIVPQLSHFASTTRRPQKIDKGQATVQIDLRPETLLRFCWLHFDGQISVTGTAASFMGYGAN